MKNNLRKIGVGYIRESTEEQDKGFSPQVQEKSIKEYAKKNNIKIRKFYKDLVSGRSVKKREDFKVMIDDAMQKSFDTIIVFHTSRFARNVEESRQYKNLLREKLGIDVISATQNFGDFNDPSSFLNEGINELFDEHYSRQLGFWVKSALMQKRSQGKPSGNTPFGYEKEKVGWDEGRKRAVYSQKWSVDKKEAEIVKRIFKMYASGNYSIQKIAETLTKEGHKTKSGNPFTYSSVKCILPNKSYLGLVWSPRKKLPDVKSTVHKAIISKKLFNQCQDVLRERKGCFGRPVAKHRFYLLQGLVFCYHCVDHMKGNEENKAKIMQPSMYCEYRRNNNDKEKEVHFYVCKFHKESRTCEQKSVRCDIIDKQMIQFMGGMKLPSDITGLLLKKLKGLFKKSKKDCKQDERLAEVFDRRKRLKTMFENGHIQEEEYLFKMQRVDEEIEHLNRQGIVNGMTVSQQEQYVKKTKKFLDEFGKFWKDGLSPEEKREWIRMTIKRIWIKNKKIYAVEPRDDFKALFLVNRKVIVQAPSLAPEKASKNKNLKVDIGKKVVREKNLSGLIAGQLYSEFFTSRKKSSMAPTTGSFFEMNL